MIVIALGILLAGGAIFVSYNYGRNIFIGVVATVIFANLVIIPRDIIRETVFKDTICISIIYSDGHQDTAYVMSNEYKRWLSYRDVLNTKFDGTIKGDEISASVPIYSTFTGNHR